MNVKHKSKITAITSWLAVCTYILGGKKTPPNMRGQYTTTHTHTPYDTHTHNSVCLVTFTTRDSRPDFNRGAPGVAQQSPHRNPVLQTASIFRRLFEKASPNPRTINRQLSFRVG